MAATRKKAAKKTAAKKKRAKAPAKRKRKKPPPKPPTAKQYLARIKKLEKAKGQKAVPWGMLSEDLFATSVTERLQTGNLGIDRLMGGNPTTGYGYAVGRIHEVASWENVGKTTILDQGMAQCQRQGGIAALFDTETARDENYTARLGVNIDELIVRPADTIEQVFAGMFTLLDIQEKVAAELKAPPPPLMMVWDAVGGTQTDAEKAGAVDDKHVGVAARNIKMNFRRLCLRLPKCRAMIVCANHFYKTIGGFSTTVSYGGSGIRYFSSFRLWMFNKGLIKLRVGPKDSKGNATEIAVGHIAEVKTKKTRLGKPHAPIETGLIWGSGFDNSYTLFEWGQKHGVRDDHKWIVRHGNWFYLMLPDGTHEGFQRKFAGLGEKLQERPDIYAQMADQYLAGGANSG